MRIVTKRIEGTEWHSTFNPYGCDFTLEIVIGNSMKKRYDSCHVQLLPIMPHYPWPWLPHGRFRHVVLYNCMLFLILPCSLCLVITLSKFCTFADGTCPNSKRTLCGITSLIREWCKAQSLRPNSCFKVCRTMLRYQGLMDTHLFY